MKSCLVVDDSKVVRMVARKILETHSVKEATIPQALHLMNNPLYMGTSRNKRVGSFLHDRLKASAKQPPAVKIRHVYNAILTRNPTELEVPASIFS